MYKSLFEDGSVPTLEEVLENREKRVAFIKKLLLINPDCTVISFKLNIPGPVKNNCGIGKIFDAGLNCIEDSITEKRWEQPYSKVLDLNTGPEYFAVVPAPAAEVKEAMVQIEEGAVLGRLFDIDVLYGSNGDISHVSRIEAGYPGRKCFVCSRDASICAGSRAHSLSDMYRSIENLISKSLRS